MLDLKTRIGRWTVAALVAAAAVAAVLALQAGTGWRQPAAAVGEAPAGRPAPPAQEARPALAAPAGKASGAPASRSASVAPSARCSFDPVLAPLGPQDGHYQLASALSMSTRPRADAFIAAAQEAAQAGRPRDAEVALIVACRLIAGRSTAPTVPMADALRLLGEHYAASAAAAPQDADAATARARQLLQESVRTYTAVLGASASRTRMARQRLAALDRLGAAAQQSAAVAAPPGAQPVAPALAVDAVAADAGAPVQLLVQADPDLAQLDDDLQRLRSQVVTLSSDPAQLERQARQAREQRDASCRDKACLLRWYERRRSELLREF